MAIRNRVKKFRGLLRTSGYKATVSRMQVLSLLESSRHPLSAQDIVEAVGSAMNQATVYRILKALNEKGLIRQIDLRHNHAHYEITKQDEHHHLVCTECGRIEDVHECGVESMHGAVIKHSKQFAIVRQHALEFYGICKVCEKKNSH